MIIGTSHFVSKQDAINYYENDEETVNQKLSEGAIHIGKPKIKEGEKIMINEEGRYEIWAEKY